MQPLPFALSFAASKQRLHSFEYKKLTDGGCVDIWLDMAYCWAVTAETHSRTRNRAQAPLPFLVGPGSIVETYTQTYGVPLDKLGILLPWWGTAFDCVGGGGAGYGGCPAVGPKESVAVAPFSDIAAGKFLRNATKPPYLNASVQTKVLNYLNATDGSGALKQLWFDDPQTLAAKYAAIKAAGVRGVGMWTADCAGNDASVAAGLWGAVPTPAGEA